MVRPPRALLEEPTTRPNRLTYDDDLFLRARRVLGIPLVNQTLWRFDDPLDTAQLVRIHAGLAAGPLNRRVVRSRVPGARDRWVASSVTAPLDIEGTTVPVGDVLAWGDMRADVDLDPECGPTWQLATARTEDGGSLLSYVTTHVACDGGSHLGAFIGAVRGTRLRRVPVDDPVAMRATLRDDLRDALHQARHAGRGLLDAWRLSRREVPSLDAQQSTDRPPRPPVPGDDVPSRVPTVVIDCDAAEWERSAREHGGTANTLLVALCVEILLATGRVEAGRPVRVALPVSTRSEDDHRSNATSAVSVAVDTDLDTDLRDGAGQVRDLAAIRSASREQFTALAAGTRHDPLEPMKPLLQLLPDPVVRRLAAGSAAPLCLASNLGELDPAFASPTGLAPSSVMMRSVTQGATRNMMRGTRGGLSSWWSRQGDVATLTLVGLDPDTFPDAETLRRATVTAMERRGVAPRPW